MAIILGAPEPALSVPKGLDTGVPGDRSSSLGWFETWEITNIRRRSTGTYIKCLESPANPQIRPSIPASPVHVDRKATTRPPFRPLPAGPALFAAADPQIFTDSLCGKF
jgi:hypothetical protein